MRHPPLEPLIDVVARLSAAGIESALGGSGLLCGLGLWEDVRDWDLTTDAGADVVRPLLAGLAYDEIGPNGIYETERMFVIRFDGGTIDLMCRLAFRDGGRVVRIPTVVRSHWNGVPLGDAAAWAEAYRALGREEKAGLLGKSPSS